MIPFINKLRAFFNFNRPNSSPTVRFVFPSLVLSLALLMGANVIGTPNQSYVKLVPSATMVKSGERFAIEVYVNAHVPVNAVDVEIDFADSVKIIGVDKAQSVLTIWTKEPTISGNTINFSGGTFRRGFVGEHIVATIKAEAVATGKTEFSVSSAQLLAGDGQGTPIALTSLTQNSRTSFIIYDEDTTDDELSVNVVVNINPDIDGDGRITIRDISSFLAAWHTQTVLYDFNDDGRMNFIDFSIILARSFLDR